MLLLPLPARPDWSRPPLATLAIMLLCIVAFLIQGKDERYYAEAWGFYTGSGVHRIEFAAYADDLARRGKAQLAERFRRGAEGNASQALLSEMEKDSGFMQDLRADRVIRPPQAEYADWRAKRNRYETLRERLVTERYGLAHSDPRPVTVLTHIFLHADVMHLAGNMACLFIVAYTVEAALGPLAFVALYLLGGIGAALPDLLLRGSDWGVSIGASGAVSAVMAAYLVLFGWRRITFFYWLLFFFGTVRWPAMVILPVWLINELLQKYLLSPGSNVNYLAHFAGFLSGALLVALWKGRQGGGEVEVVRRHDAEESLSALRRQAAVQVAAMNFGRAATIYRRMIMESPAIDERLIEEYLRIARLSKQPELIASARRKFIVAAIEPQSAISGRLLGEALSDELNEGCLPQLSAAQWKNLANRLVGASQFDVAENLLLKLAMHPACAAESLYLIERLRTALGAARQTDRLPALDRLQTVLRGRLAAALEPSGAPFGEP